jgi:hypothetical protein
MMTVKGPNGVVIKFPDGTDTATIDRVMRRAVQQQSEASPQEPASALGAIDEFSTTPQQRIGGAFETAQPVRQIDRLVEPREGLLTSRNRFGDIGPSGALRDIGSAFSTVGGITRSEIPAMVPDTGQGVTNPEVERAAKTLGAAALPINPAVRAGDLAIAGVTRAPLRRQAVAVPTRQELKQAYKTGRDEATSLGVDYNIPPVVRMASTVRAELERDGFNSETAPLTIKTLARLENPPQGAGISLEGLDTARKTFRNAAKNFTNPAEQAAASRVIDALDRFTEAPPPGSVIGGPLAEGRAQQAGDIMAEARANYAAGMRSKRFDKKRQEAELNAATANSGMNVENALRQKVKAILISDKLSAGFTPVELEEMRRFATGKRNSANVRRYIGNLLGGGGGLGQAVVAGGTAALAGGAGFGLVGPAGLAVGTVPAAVGWGLKTSANRAARRGMDELDEMIRKRSPLYKQRAADAPAAPLSAEARAAAVRALMTGDPLRIYLGGPGEAEERKRLGIPLRGQLR